jgi:hypothetical protein
VQEVIVPLPTSLALDPVLDPVSLVLLCELAEQAADLEAGLVTIVDANGHEAGSVLLYRGNIVRAFVHECARPTLQPPVRPTMDLRTPRAKPVEPEKPRSLLQRTAESLIALATHMHTLRWHGHVSPCEYDGPTFTFSEVLTAACSISAPDIAARAQRELARAPRGQRVLAYWLPPPDDVPLPIATNARDIELAELLHVGRTAQETLATTTYTGRANEVVVAGSLAIWTDMHIMYVAARTSRAVAA